MKLVLPIYLTYTASTNVCTANINIPFNVKYIDFKDVGYFAETAVGSGSNAVVVIVSDMTMQQPICMTNSANSYPSSNQNVLIEFDHPVSIKGTYNFWLYNGAGVQVNGTGTTDAVAIIAEFYDEYSMPARIRETDVGILRESGHFQPFSKS